MYLVWIGQTTNEHLRRVYHGQENPYNIGPVENYHNTCCTTLSPSLLPDLSEELPSHVYIEKVQREVTELRRKKRLDSMEFNPSDSSYDSSATALTLTRLTVSNGGVEAGLGANLPSTLITRSENYSISQQSSSQTSQSSGNNNNNKNEGTNTSIERGLSGGGGTLSPFNILQVDNNSIDNYHLEQGNETEGFIKYNTETNNTERSEKQFTELSNV